MHHKGYTKTDEAIQEYIELDESLQNEYEEARKIAESGIKKIVPNLVYGSHFDPSDCTHCMNFDYENEICKKNISYTDTECDEWDYIYKTEK